ncbi:MAG TPA: HAD family hydrolase [Candidatus Eisenbacteria bacterium]|nr:HAD family hydrolase [Candidatus Eisenbacteria bacterium]
MNDVRFHVKGVILDLDGTIVDSKEAYSDAAAKAFSAFGQTLVNDKTAFEIPKRFELGLSLDDLTQGIAVRSFCEVYLKAYYAATAVKSKPFPHVAEALERLSKKAKLALTTRRYVPKDEVAKQLSEIGLSKYLDVIVTGVDTLNPKPSPEPLLKCASEMDVRISDCIVVGDSVTDIKAGKNAGTKTVGVLSGIFSLDELRSANPDLILENITKLPLYIE